MIIRQHLAKLHILLIKQIPTLQNTQIKACIAYLNNLLSKRGELLKTAWPLLTSEDKMLQLP